MSVPGLESVDGSGDILYEISISGMFPLDGPAIFVKTDKLSFLVEVI